MNPDQAHPKSTIIDAKQAIFDKIFKENQDLRDLNQELNLMLESFEQRAREREEQLNRFESLEDRLLNTRDLSGLTVTVQKILANDFDIPITGIALLEAVDKESSTNLDKVMETIVEAQKSDLPPVLSIISEENYKRLFPEQKPIITQQPDPVLSNLFATDAKIKSAAFIPLLSRTRCIGILNLASPDPKKFIPGTATDTVEKLCRILATAVENNLLEARIRQFEESIPE